MLAAAAVVLAAFVSVELARTFFSARIPYATIEVAADSAYKVGDRVEAGKMLHIAGKDSVVLALADGSRVEAAARSEFMLEPSIEGDVCLRLNQGSLIVTAAKQRTGRLFVHTEHATASVMGTVFLVKAEDHGTRVAVLEGEVQVEQGPSLKQLRAGQDIGTDALMTLRPLVEEIAWSRNASSHQALLLESAVAESQASAAQARHEPGPAPALEVASTRAPRVALPETAATFIAAQERGTPERQQPQEPPKPAPTPEPRQPTPEPQPKTQPTPEPQPKTPEPEPQKHPGQPIFDRTCTTCHGPDAMKSQTSTQRSDYADMVSRMTAIGATVSEQEFPLLVDYLWITFGRPKQ
jgi:hypothetical protein